MLMKILMLEDDDNEVQRFKNYISLESEFELISTNSIVEAIHYLKKYKIEGVIVDIELNKGIGGSGIDFLKELNTTPLEIRPLIIVTTKNESEIIYKACRNEGVDMIYYKSKQDYSPLIILNQFITLRPYLKKSKVKSNIETDLERSKRIEKMIKKELDLIGVPPNMKGYAYIFDSILYLIENDEKDDCYYTNYLYEKYKVRKGGISTSMQDAINKAWRNTPEDDLLDNFTANISYDRGTPSPTQLIHYYVEKIKINI